jgi:phosphoesterase RecJ-like protein
MSVSKLAAWMREHDDFLVVSHTYPDGDAVGSMLAVTHILKHLGKRVVMYSATGIPEAYDWLEFPVPVITRLIQLDQLNFKTTACLALDCGDLIRTGDELTEAWQSGKFATTASIDHHRDNPMFADINWVESSAAATAQLIGELAEFLDMSLSGPLGEAVYLGIAEDTGNFKYNNTSAEILDMAADIVRQGLPVGVFNDQLSQWSLAKLKAWVELLSFIETAFAGRVVYVVAEQDFFDRHNLPSTDYSDFSSFLRRIRGAYIGLFIRATGAHTSKASLRSKGLVDVCKAAQAFGGGGHRNAAGVEVAMPAREALAELLSRLEESLFEAEEPGNG